MSNIDNMTANEQLFTELTSEEGSAVSGGADSIGVTHQLIVPQENVIKINNKTNLPVYLDLDFGGERYQDFRLGANQSHNFTARADKAIIDYDKDFGQPGIQLQSYTLRPSKQYNFRLTGLKLNLFDGGSIA